MVTRVFLFGHALFEPFSLKQKSDVAKRSLFEKRPTTVTMVKRKPASAPKAPNKRSRNSEQLDESSWESGDDEPQAELPRSAYELQCQDKIANNQQALNQLDARLDMSEEPRTTDGAQKQAKKRCEPKPLHAHAAVPL